ncbi:MAG: SBBP repeat-containing protein [Acidobacteria bacterium]|nr:SBBP repeat-containing protein [Acidobacteriota bacterium]
MLLCLGIQRVFRHDRAKLSVGSVSSIHPVDEGLDGARSLDLYNALPISFEPNRGQTSSEVHFLSRGKQYGLFLTQEEVVLVLVRRTVKHESTKDQPFDEAVIRMSWSGGNRHPRISALEPLPGFSNHYVSRNSASVVEEVPNYSRIRYSEIYPGVDLVFYGTQTQLEYDLVVAPGTDPGVIRLSFEGSTGRRVDSQGNLILPTSAGDLILRAPRAYQRVNHEEKVIESRYRLVKPDQVAFEVGSYDRSKPLIIDPIIAYSSFFGGSDLDDGNDIALLLSDRSLFIVGMTASADFPHTATNPPAQAAPGGSFDGYVTRVDPLGRSRVYSTFFGGSSVDLAGGVAVDASGNAYVTGLTASSDFTTRNAVQSSLNGSNDAFLAKFSPTGTLLFSTYFGGSAEEHSGAIAVDAAGDVYVAGSTSGTAFRATTAQFGSGGNGDVWVAKFTSSGSVTYFSMLGGQLFDSANGIAVAQGIAYITGHTQSNNFPTANAVQGSYAGANDVFLTALNSSGSGLVFSTFFGGSADDIASDIAVEDGTGDVAIAGNTSSNESYAMSFPVVNATQPVYGGGSSDAFVAKFSKNGAVQFSTFLGGCLDDYGSGVAIDNATVVDASGRVQYVANVYATGSTLSTNFPLVTPIQASLAGGFDVWVSKLNNVGTLMFSTYLGGGANDRSTGIVVTPTGTASVIGTTFSGNYPTSADALQRTLGGSSEISDAFLTRLTTDNLPGEMLPPFAAAGSWTRSVRVDSNGNGIPDPADQPQSILRSTSGQDVNLRFLSATWNPCNANNTVVRLSKSNSQLATFDTLTRVKESTRRTSTVTAQIGGTSTSSSTLRLASAGTATRLAIGGRPDLVTLNEQIVRKAGGSTVSQSGTVRAADQNSDGVVDAFTAQRAGQPAVTISPVFYDVNGDKKADFVSMPWALSYLLGLNFRDRVPDPQVFIPLGDTNGDGTPDSPAFDFDNNNQADAGFPLLPMVSGTGTAAEYQLFFAHFGDGRAGAAQIFSQITAVNLEDQEASVRIQLRDGAGQPLSVDLNGEMVNGEQTLTIPAGGVRFLKTDGEGPLQSGSVVVASTRRLSGVILFGGSVGMAGVGSSQELPGGFMAPMEMNSAEATATGIAIQNLGNSVLTGTVQLYGSAGNLIASANLGPIPANGQVAQFLNQFA